MAMTFAAYAVPEGWQRPVARRGGRRARAGQLRGGHPDRGADARHRRPRAAGARRRRGSPASGGGHAGGLGGLGRSRTVPTACCSRPDCCSSRSPATPGSRPSARRSASRTRVDPAGDLVALAGAVVVYAVVGVAVLSPLGPVATAASSQPLADAVAAGSWDWAVPVVRVGAAAGRARCAARPGRRARAVPRLAMAREGDLPRWLAAVHPAYRVPHRAELASPPSWSCLVLVADLRGVIGFSSFGVLLYYFVANAAARAQGRGQRRYPRRLQLLGCAGCLLLVATLPWQSVLAGVAVFAVGIGVRLVRLRLRSGREVGVLGSGTAGRPTAFYRTLRPPRLTPTPPLESGAVKALVIGTGGREHALVARAGPRPGRRRGARGPGQPGHRRSSPRCTRVDPMSGEAVAALATALGVGPRRRRARGAPGRRGRRRRHRRRDHCFGPPPRSGPAGGVQGVRQGRMNAAGVPDRGRARLHTRRRGAAALDALGAPYVVKDDGLAAGKGVVVTSDRAAAVEDAAALRAGRRSRSTSTVPRSRSSPSVTARRSYRCCRPRTSSGSSTATRAPTPAAWAPIRRCRGAGRPGRRGDPRRRSGHGRGAGLGGAPRSAACSTPAWRHLGRRPGRGVQRPVRRPGDPAPAGVARLAAVPRC